MKLIAQLSFGTAIFQLVNEEENYKTIEMVLNKDIVCYKIENSLFSSLENFIREKFIAHSVKLST